MLIGTKSDIAKIESEKIEQVKKKYGFAFYVPTSAKKLQGMSEAFKRCVDAANGEKDNAGGSTEQSAPVQQAAPVEKVEEKKEEPPKKKGFFSGWF